MFSLTSDAPTQMHDARVAIFSPRGFHHHVSRSHGYEFEDVILNELDEGTLFAPQPERHHAFLSKVKNKLSYRTALAEKLSSGLQTLRCEQDHALFFYTVAHLRDLNCLDALPDWRSRSGTAICWIQELWLGDFAGLGPLLYRLNAFDHVICSFAQTAEALSERLSVPVHYIPWGLDAVHFCPYPNPPRRAIDVLSIGVRHDTTHAALIDYADRTGQFYSYETISGRAGMQDYRGHRHNYVGLLQRSRYFFSYVAKVERTVERGSQTEFGLRYLEGLAAGAVVLGTHIDSDAFRKHIGWTDAVIDVPYECADIGSIIDELDAQPSRLEAIRMRNILECLERHDHLYRWEQVLELAGMDAHSKLAQRRSALRGLIREIKQGQPKVSAAI